MVGLGHADSDLDRHFMKHTERCRPASVWEPHSPKPALIAAMGDQAQQTVAADSDAHAAIAVALVEAFEPVVQVSED